MAKEEAKDLSDEEMDFYSRQIVLKEIGYNGQLKLKDSKACVVGLGGLGSPAALQLAAIGIGHLRLIERDVVELSNLHRQHLYGVSYVGYPKVEVAAKRLSELNPNVEIEPLPFSLNANNATDLVKDVDVVVDGLDQMAPRYALNRACQKAGVPYIFGGAIMTYGNASTIIPGKTPCLECFQGNLSDERLPKCAVVGVHPSILGIIASVEVSEAVKIILGEKPNLAGKLFCCDIGAMQFEQIDIAKAENCPICGSTPSSPPINLEQKLITEVCGREGRRTFVVTPKLDLKLRISELSTILKKYGFKIEVKANLGITFTSGSEMRVSILKSGVMIIDGADSEGEVQNFYRKIVANDLKIPLSKIE